MLTEQDLQEALADAVDDPAAEQYTLGLSDRALAEAGEDSRWRRPMTGKRGKLVPGIAIGSAFAVAAAVGAVALSGGEAGDGSPAALAAPRTPANPAAQEGVTAFGVQCFDDHGPKLDPTYVWDPATRRYHGVAGEVPTEFHPSPDGKRALVLRGEWGNAQSWAVADWSDAVAGRVTPNPVLDTSGVHWTADGKEVVGDLTWDMGKAGGTRVLKNKTADFYDPASGRRLASVPFPAPVRTMVASGRWSLQEFQGDHDSVLFPLLSADGDRLEYLNAQGTTVRTLTLQEGLAGNVSNQSELAESAQLSPDGRYLAEADGSVLAVFDLQAGGRRVAWMNATGYISQGWIGDHQIVTVVDKNEKLSGSRGDPFPLTGHSPVYSVLTPELKVVQQTTFVLPADPGGACTTWPVSWAPVGQFPGVFVP